MNEEIIKTFPESGQKIVSLVKNENYGGLCIKKVQKDISFIARIKKEINIQKELNCIYFPKIYYAKIDESECLIYEEYIEGDNLTKYVGKNSKFYNNENECLKMLKELVIGLSFVWKKNVVHRDKDYNWHFSKPQCYKHYMVSFSSLIKNLPADLDERYQYVDKLLEQANNAFNELSNFVFFDNNSSGDHINKWRTALKSYYTKIKE